MSKNDSLFSQPERLSKRNNLLQVERPISGRKVSFEAPDRFKDVVDTSDKNVSFPTTPALLILIFLQDCSSRMQEQDDHNQLNGKRKSSPQETIFSDKAALDEEALWKKLPQTAG